MKIALFNQKNRFKKYLEELKQVPVIAYERSALIEKISSIKISGVSHLNQLNLAFFFDYRIFPENILSGYPQWRDEQRSIQAGDTILQQVYLPPIPKFSQKALFGVRIKEVIREENRLGFSYETLKGHVECGISYFIMEETAGKIFFRIQTFSKPGNLLTRMLGPVFSIPYQTYCTKKALKHVKKSIELQLPHT
ncbi:DUF1990 family protein [uncultured Fluviicola sp.]|uniref:DUF1990 family protein n=1 Tax=uncultured Fluviicola sp. TaxID=463303 RepID=UPI0025F4569E|nr:DUF1990 family protein [uncultured Fluviicola sp.]